MAERSREEREAARIERERRRAEREGREPAPAPEAVPPPPADAIAPPPGDPVAPPPGDAIAPPSGDAGAPSPAEVTAPPPLRVRRSKAPQPRQAPDSEPVWEQVADAVPEPQPEPVAARQPQPEPAGVSARPIRSFPSPPDPDFYAPEESDGEWEEPSGTRRVSRLGHARDRKPRPVKRRRRPSGPRRGHSWRGRIASLIGLVLGAALVWFLVELFQPLGTSPHGTVTVTIPPEASSKEIGKLLVADKVVPSSFFFELRATLAGDRGDMRAGTYHLRQDMTYGDVLKKLTTPPPVAKTTQLTIAEGHTREYVSELLRKQKMKGNYLAATRHSPMLDPHTYGAPKHTTTLEGFLFPDTFTLVDPVKVSALVKDQLQDFKRRFATVNMSTARRLHLTPYDVLTVASLIEAEAASPRDRPLVASVIYNRLKDHMMLQLDSTARYATGNFTRPLKVSQLRSSSPYNTHTHLGLPPTPIDSPGLASIRAAAAPAHSHYLYFFSKPCTSRTVFASSYAQFQNLLVADRREHCGH